MSLLGIKHNADLRILGNIFSNESIYQQSILDIQTDAVLDPGASPAKGDRYILSNTAALNANFGTITGVGNNDIVEYDGSDFIIVWDASAQGAGAQAFDKDSGSQYFFNGTSWALNSHPDGGDGITFNSGDNRFDLDLADTNPGLELTASDGTGELRLSSQGNGIAGGAGSLLSVDPATEVAGSRAAVYVGADGVGVDLDNSSLDHASSILQVKDLGISTAKLAADSVITSKILDANVTSAKLASGIDAAKLADGSVSNTEFQFINSLSSNAQDQLDAKQATSEKGQANGYASLDANSKIPSSQLPAIAITDVFTVADITARDALTIGTGDGEVQEGDVAIVTDASDDPAITSGAASYIYNGSSWSLLKAGDEVLSVNGDTGTVTVNAINQLTGDVTTSAASGSQSLVSTIANSAITAAKLDYASTGLRSGAATDAFSISQTRTFTHNWATFDVAVEMYDSVTYETVYGEVSRPTNNTVVITLNQEPVNSIRVMLREVNPTQTTIGVS